MITLAISQKQIVSLVIASILAGILLPIGLVDLVNIANAQVTVNGSSVNFSTVAPASIITLLGTVVPIVIVIAVLLGFLKGE